MSPVKVVAGIIAIWAIGSIVSQIAGLTLEQTRVGEWFKDHPCLVCGGSGWLPVIALDPEHGNFTVQVPCPIPVPHYGD
jgi:hypothetical protein